MLVQFSVKNFLSFRDPVTLSMIAAPELDAEEGKLENTFETPFGFRLLKSAAIYGANASGKSNLISAIKTARKLIVSSATRLQSQDRLPAQPFRLSATSVNQPSEFSIIWIDDELYHYDFAIDEKSVFSEKLTKRTHKDNSEIELFSRSQDQIYIAKDFPEGKGLEKRTRANSLFLSVADQFNVKMAEKILRWFNQALGPVSGLEDDIARKYTAYQLSKGQWKSEIIELSRKADFDIIDIIAKQESDENVKLQTLKRKFDPEGMPSGSVEFDFESESEGTKKFISMTGLLLFVFGRGAAMVVDEFDARLHPSLTRAIVELFHSPANRNNAQLIFATHDTNLLDRRLLRRDQIWFTEKDKYGGTDLYSLAQFKVDSTANYEHDYIQGKYGAIPYIHPLIAPNNEEK